MLFWISYEFNITKLFFTRYLSLKKFNINDDDDDEQQMPTLVQLWTLVKWHVAVAGASKMG